jgi:hypothetical protein
MSPIPGDEHGRDDAEADLIDRVGDKPDIDPLEGLMDPEKGTNSPVSDTDAPVPPG